MTRRATATKVLRFPTADPLERRLDRARDAAQRDELVRAALEQWFRTRTSRAELAAEGKVLLGLTLAEWIQRNPPPTNRAEAEESWQRSCDESRALLAYAGLDGFDRSIAEQMRPRGAR